MFFRLLLSTIVLVLLPASVARAQVELPVAPPLGGERGYVRLWAANDMFYVPNRTDQYYSAGIGGEYVLYPTERTWVTYGVRQDIFTPKEIEAVTLLTNDRPFASTLLAAGGWGNFREGGLRLGHRLTLGVLGKPAGGGKTQNAFHRMVDFADEVPGWVNEVEADVVVNYRFTASKDWLPTSPTAVVTYGRAEVGSLYTNATAGARLGRTWAGSKARWRFHLAAAQELRAVGYNATLSGGLLNRDMRYLRTVRPERVVLQSLVTASLRYGFLGANATVVHTGPEFVGGEGHTYVVFAVRAHW